MKYRIRINYIALAAIAAVILLTTTPLHPVVAVALGAVAPLVVALATYAVILLGIGILSGVLAAGVAIDRGTPVVVYLDDIEDLLHLVEVGEIRDPEGYVKDFANRVGVE